jgi:uncharacterized protein (DUF1499 family)
MSRFKSVSSAPNSVSSRAEASDAQHFIAPLTASLDEIRAAMESIPRTTLKNASKGYLHYVCTTRLMRFKDDVEFEVEGDVVHVRSASRLGHSDLGVNRRRVEQLREALA